MAVKHRWQKGFFGSMLFHVCAFLVVGFVAAAGANQVINQNDYVEVDYFAGTGGGGGGGSEKPLTHSILDDKPTAPADNAVQNNPDVQQHNYDPEQIVDKTKKAEDKQNANQANNDSRPIYPGSDKLSGTGSGVGSGKGPGSGSGSGGGHGSGTGTGIGSGSGSGTGGGASQTAVTPPRKIAGGQPPYPEDARQACIEGNVGLKIYISATGAIDDVVVSASSGNASLDNAAVRTVRSTYRFQPGKNNVGAPVKCVMNHRVVFSLK